MTSIACVALLLGLTYRVSGQVGRANASESSPRVDEAVLAQLYHNVEPVDIEASRRKLAELRLSRFEFRYDSIAGRRQVGVLPDDAREVLPEAVELSPHRTFPPQEPGGPLVRVEDFPSVDKNVVFMHNVAAVQAISKALERTAAKLEELLEHGEEMDVLYDELHRRLQLEADAQAVERRKLAEAEAEKARLDVVRAKAAEEEAARILAARELAETQRLQREDELARERAALADMAERNRTLEALAMQRETAEAAARQAQLREQELSERRAALEKELEESRRVADISRAESEAKAKALLLRETKDIRERRAAAEAEAERKRLLETISTVMDRLGNAVFYLLEEPSRLANFVLVVVSIIAASMITREAAAMARRYIEASIGRPRLLRESSVSGGVFGQLLRVLKVHLLLDLYEAYATSWSGHGRDRRVQVEKHFSDVILPPSCKDRILLAARIAKGSRELRAPLRNVLLYGPPGTGKTMIARRLAAASGLDYAVMSGGDVAAVGADSVRQLHDLFAWAQRSPRGLILFIDEAEAFLSSRARDMTEETRSALNALLFHTGTASSRFCLVLATNRAEDLDSAVLDRMDDSLLIDVPEQEQRQQILCQYMLKSFEPWNGAPNDLGRPRSFWQRMLQGKSTRLPVDSGLTNEQVQAAAERMKGFSGREISKFVSSLHSTALCAPGRILDQDSFGQLVEDKVLEHMEREKMVQEWRNGTD